MFVSPANNVEFENNDVKTVLVCENIDKGKSILGAPPKLDKKETKNPVLVLFIYLFFLCRFLLVFETILTWELL